MTIYFKGNIVDSTDTGFFGPAGDGLQKGLPFSGSIQYDPAQAPSDTDGRFEFGRYESNAFDWLSASLRIGSRAFHIEHPATCCAFNSRQQIIVGDNYDNQWDAFQLDLAEYDASAQTSVGIYSPFYDDTAPLTLTVGTSLPTSISWTAAESAHFESYMNYSVSRPNPQGTEDFYATGYAFLTHVSTTPFPPTIFTASASPVGLYTLNDTVSGVGFCILGHPTLGPNCADPDGSGPLQLGDGHQYSGNLADIAFAADGSYYVTDLFQVRKFGPDDKMITTWTTSGDAHGVAVDSQGSVWVSTRNGNTISKYDSEGNALPGSIAVGQRLSAVHVDANDNIFIGLDGPALGEVRKYDPAGNLLLTLYPIHNPQSIDTDSQGNIYVLASMGCTCSTGTILKFAPNGSAITYVDTIARDNYAPWDLAIDAADQLWVTTGNRHRVAVLNTDLIEIFSAGSEGTGPGQLNTSGRLAFNPDGDRLYLSDMNNTGQSVKVWGKLPPTPPIITPVVTGTLGNAGWYTGNVSLSWNVSDPDWPVTTQSSCNALTITFNTPSLVRTCTATSADGTASASVTIRRDATAPIVTGATFSRDPNANGWFNADVTVSFAGSDGANQSGVANCSSTTLSINGANQTAVGTCTDVAGNVSAPFTVDGINIDKSAPGVTIAVPANGATYGVGVTVTATFSCNGAISGLETCVGPVASGAALDTATPGTKTFAVTAKDKAGNEFTRSYTYIVSESGDVTPPVIAPELSGTLGTDGWYVGDVRLTWQVTDPDSSVTSSTGCQARNITNNTMGVTYTCSATSGGGTASASVTIKRAATPPTINVNVPVEGGTYYQGSLQNAKYTCSGAPSGVASCVGPVAHNTPFDTSSTGQREFSVVATTVAGLTTTKVVNYTVVADPTPPSITPTITGTLGNNGWYRSNVTVRFAVTEAESSISSTVGCSNSTVNTNTPGVTFTCTAISAGGSESQSVTVARDATLPTITVTMPKNNATYARDSVVIANYACADANSGLASDGCTGPVASGAAIDTSTPGTKAFTVLAVDAAGNSRTVTRTYTVP